MFIILGLSSQLILNYVAALSKSNNPINQTSLFHRNFHELFSYESGNEMEDYIVDLQIMKLKKEPFL